VTIRNREKFNTWLPAAYDGEFDWDFLRAAFKNAYEDSVGITPMDFDAVIERGRQVLIFETKEDASVPIKYGQGRTLQTMWREKKCTIVHLIGKTPQTISGAAWYHGNEKCKTDMIGDREILPCNAAKLVYHVYRWRLWAEGRESAAPDFDEFISHQLWLNDYDGDAKGSPVSLGDCGSVTVNDGHPMIQVRADDWEAAIARINKQYGREADQRREPTS